MRKLLGVFLSFVLSTVALADTVSSPTYWLQNGSNAIKYAGAIKVGSGSTGFQVNSSGVVTFGNAAGTTLSNNTLNLVVNGGVGTIANSTGTSTSGLKLLGSAATNGYVIIQSTNSASASGDTVTIQGGVNGTVPLATFAGSAATVTINPTTASSSTTTGALIDNGGLGVAGAVNIGGAVAASSYTGLSGNGLMGVPFTSLNEGTVYLAATDGIITCNVTTTSASNNLAGIVGSTSTPNIQLVEISGVGSGVQNSITFPVKKGWYWEITDINEASTPTIYFTPVGA